MSHPTAGPATVVLQAAMDARAANLRQQRLLMLAGRMVELVNATSLSPRQRALVIAAEGLLGEFSKLAAEQGEQHRVIAGLADRLDRSDANPWSLRRVVRETRDPLADLLNPIIRGERRREALEAIRRVLADAPPVLIGTVAAPNVGLRHQLGVRKYSLLLEFAAERIASC